MTGLCKTSGEAAPQNRLAIFVGRFAPHAPKPCGLRHGAANPPLVTYLNFSTIPERIDIFYYVNLGDVIIRHILESR